MKKPQLSIPLFSILILFYVLYFSFNTFAQNAPNDESFSSKKIGGGLTIGGYGQIDYNQPFGGELRKNGTLDVHRMVLMIGYRFDARTQFITELEWEHINEMAVEQAFIQYKLTSTVNLKAGQILIPMGMLNEYHEPLSFNGVERPLIDNVIAPTTWNALGAGITGLFPALSLKYQAYLVNGISTYTDAPTIGGSGIRNARQEGTAFLSSPNISLKAEYFGLKNLQLGVALYAGNTQSTLYNDVDRKSSSALAKADSSVVNLTMIGVDVKYRLKALQLKGQFYYSWISNTNQYNQFSAVNGKLNDLGNETLGWYLEAGYNLFSHLNISQKELTPFVRIEHYNTHQNAGSLISVNPKYNNTAYTAGVGFKLNRNTVVKTDFLFLKSKVDNEFAKTFNAGIGIIF